MRKDFLNHFRPNLYFSTLVTASAILLLASSSYFTAAAQAAEESRFLAGFGEYRRTVTVQKRNFSGPAGVNTSGLRQVTRHAMVSRKPVESRTYLRFGLRIYDFDAVGSAEAAFNELRAYIEEGTYKSPEYIVLKDNRIYWLSGACLYSRVNWEAIERKLADALGANDGSAIKVMCGGSVASNGPIDAKADKIIYRFRDSSVPPQYHRSYTITVTNSNAKLVIDSYGTILSESLIDIPDEQFEQVLETVRSGRITIRAEVKPKMGCTGGTLESIAMFRGKDTLLEGDVYHCGGTDYGTLTGNIKAVKAALTALFPDLGVKLK